MRSLRTLSVLMATATIVGTTSFPTTLVPQRAEAKLATADVDRVLAELAAWSAHRACLLSEGPGLHARPLSAS